MKDKDKSNDKRQLRQLRQWLQIKIKKSSTRDKKREANNLKERLVVTLR